jgi:hypothetical protein
MPDTIVDPKVSQEDQDVESELCSSSREVCTGFVPFANFDLWILRSALSRVERDSHCAWRR